MNPALPACLAILLSAWLFPSPLGAQEPATGDTMAPCPAGRVETEVLRLVPGEKAMVLQTPRWLLYNPGGCIVELTGAFHLAEKAYFEDLNQHFRSFDAVLFEAPCDREDVERMQGKRPRAGPLFAEDGFAAAFRSISLTLGDVSFQPDEVDYTAANFVHADLGPSDMTAEFGKRGLPSGDPAIRDLGADPSMENFAAALPGGKGLAPPDDPQALRRALAAFMVQLVETEARKPQDDANARAERLIDGLREARALEVLDRELAAGKRHISIFYGSAHLPYLKKRLLEKGWKVANVKWLDAWTIPNPPGKAR